MQKKNIKEKMPANMFYNPFYTYFVFFYKIKDCITNF